MDLGLKNKVAVVTGSSKGIGKAIATGLADEGCSLVICGRHKDSLEITANEIKKIHNVEVLSVETDLTKNEDIKTLFQTTVDNFDSIDILINNTGGPPPLFFDQTILTDWNNAVDQLLYSMISCCYESIPLMKKNSWGRIINMTSIAAKQPIDKLILSNTLRAGILGFTKTVANEVSKFGICINAVCPGYTLTKRVEELAISLSNNNDPSGIIKRWEDEIPIGRLAKPEEIANMVVFLSSEKASYITGNVVQVDGGYYKAIM